MARLAQTAGLTDVQQEILSTVRDFVDKEIILVATELEHRDEYPQQIVDGLKEGPVRVDDPRGVRGPGPVPPHLRAASRRSPCGWMSVSGIINTHFIVAYMLKQHGTQEQKDHFLPDSPGRGARRVLDVGAGSRLGRLRDHLEGGQGRRRVRPERSEDVAERTAARRTWWPCSYEVTKGTRRALRPTSR